MNDSTEMIYIEGILADVAQELRDDNDVTEAIAEYAVHAAAGTGRFSPTELRTASVISLLEQAPTMSDRVFDVYVSCFCEWGDLLSQWRGYPSGGGGYALGLRPESIRRGGGVFRNVVYDERTQRRLLYDLLAPIVEAMSSASAEEGKGLWDWLTGEHFARVYASLQECSFCFKHPGFTEESEWRLVILRARDAAEGSGEPPPNVRATRTGLLPYLKRSLEAEAVAEVFVGPSSQPSLAADAAVQLLRNAGYPNAREIVVHSAIPLRV